MGETSDILHSNFQFQFDFYRFSISWSRILPTGFPDNINKAGIKYYSDLIDELHSKGIEPVATIFHFDYPITFAKFGGLANESVVEWLADYSRVIFRELGPKIKKFVTINEPNILCSYSGKY